MTDLDRYLWNSYLGRIKPDRLTCDGCGRPIIESSGWWVDAETFTPECGFGPAWTGHAPGCGNSLDS